MCLVCISFRSSFSPFFFLWRTGDQRKPISESRNLLNLPFHHNQKSQGSLASQHAVMSSATLSPHPPNPQSEEVVEVRTLTKEDIEMASEVCAGAFGTGLEPMCRSMGVNYDDFYEFTLEFLRARQHQDLSSVVCIDGKVVACVCVEEHNSLVPPNWSPLLMQKMGPILSFLDAMDLDLPTHITGHGGHGGGVGLGDAANPHAHTTPAGPSAHMLLIASSVHGRGFAKLALDHAHHLARARGMRGAYAECTGPISQHIFSKAGYVSVRRYPYSTWEANTDPDVARGHCELLATTL